MVKKLISFEDEAEGLGLPDVVEDRLDGAFARVFGVAAPTPDPAENTSMIQAALDAAGAVGGGTVLLSAGKTYDVSGTLYLRNSLVTLDGNAATLRMTSDATQDDVDLGVDTYLPRYTHAILLVLGQIDSRIHGCAVQNITLDGAANPATSGRWANLVVAHADRTNINQVISLHSGELAGAGGGNSGLCLLIQSADDTVVTGGRFAHAGYDAVRVAGGALRTQFITVRADTATRGAVQITPGSRYTTFIGCSLDNSEGGQATSHALFGHNAHEVDVIGGTLSATSGSAIRFFGDGDAERGERTDGIRVRGANIVHGGSAPAISFGNSGEDWVSNVAIDATVEKAGTLNMVQSHGGNNLKFKIQGTSSSVSSCYTLTDVRDFSIDTDTTTASTGNAHVLATRCSKGRISGKAKQVAGQSVALFDCNDITITGLAPITSDGIYAVGNQTGIEVLDNDFRGVSHANPLRVYATTSGRVRGNLGAPTEGNGTAVVGPDSTAVTITHGLWQGTSTTSADRIERFWHPRDFQVSFAGDPGEATTCWVSSVTPTQVTITLDAAPGVDVPISWSARMDRTTQPGV